MCEAAAHGRPDWRKAWRIRTRPEITAVQRKGRRVSGAGLVVFTLPTGVPHPRFALTVSRKVGGAVVRNRVKRRLREVLRRARPEGCAWDVVVMATPEAARMSSASLWAETLRLLLRAKVIDAGGCERVRAVWDR